MPSERTQRSRRVHIRIREAGEGDIKEVVGLWDLLVQHHRQYSDHFRLAKDGRARWAEHLREKLTEPSTKLIVAEEDDELVGFMLCLLYPGRPIFDEKAVGVISDAFVREDRRQKGVMREMLRVALRWFDKNRMKAVEISVSASNLEGRSAWGQLGFRPLMVKKRLQLDSYHARTLIDGENNAPGKKTVRRVRGE